MGHDVESEASSSTSAAPSSSTKCQDFSWIVERPYTIVKGNEHNSGASVDTYGFNDRNNNFSLVLANELYGVSEEECEAKRASISQKMKQAFHSPEPEIEEGIPLITHRIWITSADSPVEASTERLGIYLKSLKKLQSKAWTHHFWCINKNKIPQTIQTLQASEVPIVIHELEEIYAKMKVKHIFDAYYEDKQFCLASDIARQEVIYLYGGLYSDLGADFLTDLEPFLNKYTYIFWYNGLYIDQTFFGYRQFDTIAEIFFNNLKRLPKMPKQIKNLTSKQDWKSQIWGSGAHFMTLFDVFSTPKDRFLLVPEGSKSIVQINHAGSWLGREKSGNKPLTESTLDIMELKVAA
ncbi:glycosyltransferase [Candidatus Finniella inopinata]|uniref:Uncharacterized protein n=1 Tax=Candidatus Finniella inopinata TaxID=1696036 RepID=A0A4Q7DJR9_9PROT|nr:glycosyltransferase [Candidatus Finniella inopinata]RZI46284.1 hypothetical protein EQU50_04940 [Candidatus Finniella inopinata]